MRLFAGLLALLLTLGMCQSAQGYRILFLAPISSKSMKGFFTSMISALAQRGHEITVVSPYAPQKQTPNVREIVIDKLDLSSFMPNVFKAGGMSPFKLIAQTPVKCADALEEPQVQQLFNEKFDLVMLTTFFSECFLVFASQLKVPLVYVNPAALLPHLEEISGNPHFPSFQPVFILDGKHPMTFGTRVINTLFTVFLPLMYKYLHLPAMEKECMSRNLYPDDFRLADVQGKPSLTFINGITAMDIPRAYVPNVIHAGGLHLRPAQPLPKDLEDWVQAAGEPGFILFSLGSAARPSDMPEEFRQMLVNVFGQLEQRVLWKWDQEDMADLPPNVRISKWLPQQDILGHPKLRAFFSHGGLHSVQEAVFHGAPVLGMPLFSDQMTNINAGVRQGWAVMLDWKTLTEEKLLASLKAVMEDSSLLENSKRVAILARDQPMTPSEVVGYWTEYVIKHGGAAHLQSPAADMNWFYKYNWDVWITIITTVCVVIGMSLVTLLWCLRKYFHASIKKKTE
ncbi:UDP-glucosyltransferase 2-like [Oratosquilla oratoria]|uniref:UDP-glucosyltransferase 2-like n=1 Tax=Oratosquilla oratoria TaxID=337810 RepID=UPI003F771467